MKDLTARQSLCLEFIRSSIANGYPPTLREIGMHMGIRSTNGVNDHLRALERKGYLVRADLKSRGIRVVDTAAPMPIRPTKSIRDELIALRTDLKRQSSHLETVRSYVGLTLARVEGLLADINGEAPVVTAPPMAADAETDFARLT